MIRTFLHDLVACWTLFTACVVFGFVLNLFRTAPLPVFYASPQKRLDEVIQQIRQTYTSIPSEATVTTSEIKALVDSHKALILDARPAIFYRYGHIPTARSLPREEFESRYDQLKASFLSRDELIVVYCAEEDCHDSALVVAALRKFGYTNVKRYSGGWAAWQKARYPEDNKEK